MSAQDCAIILLASGLSTRFGTDDKLLAQLCGKPVIDHTIANIDPVHFGLKIAVIGAHAHVKTDLQDRLSQAGYQIIFNRAPAKGQGSSLALGAQAVLDAGFERACIALADMPCVPSPHFKTMLDLAKTSAQVVSETEIDGCAITLPPCVLSGSSLQRLTQAHGDEGARRHLRGANAVRQKLSKWAAKDIDTLDDLQALEQHMKDVST